jgi:hypothetical protein
MGSLECFDNDDDGNDHFWIRIPLENPADAQILKTFPEFH